MAGTKRDYEGPIHVEALERNLKEKMSGNLSIPSTCSIFRIPTTIIRDSPNSYLPNQFSFGPFHHHNDTLKHTQKIKFKYLLDLLTRLSQTSNQIENLYPSDDSGMLKALTNAVVDVGKEAWGYYSGPIEMQETKFVEVLLIDGCFIVELFRKKSYESLRETDDTIFSTSIMLQFLWHDLILLENQVPWMVLEKLFDLTVSPVDEKPLVQLTIEFFETFFTTKPPPIEPLVDDLRENKHILDLLRNWLVLPSEVRHHKSLSGEPMPMSSATILEESGIKMRRGDSSSILDVRLNHYGVLVIPPLLIHDATETVFRNLISLEQLCPNYDSVFTSYAFLLGSLINTTKDIEILCKSRAIINWLDIQSAEFFNKLPTGSFLKESYYQRLSYQLNMHCKRRWPRYRMVLIRYYFNNPWALISLSVAAFLVICSFLQTLYTINNHPWAYIFLIVVAVLVACAFLKTLFTIRK